MTLHESSRLTLDNLENASMPALTKRLAPPDAWAPGISMTVLEDVAGKEMFWKECGETAE